VCRDIVGYLLRHNEAADTAHGIANWWIRSDVARTSHALACLLQHGVVRAHVVQGTISVYTLTKDRTLRQVLRRYVDGVGSTVTTESP